MFLGTTFTNTDRALQPTSVCNEDINKVKIKNIILDELYATKDVLIKFNWEIPTDWFYNTLLHALYQNNVYAGNVKYSESIVQKIKIKRRYQGEFDWKTLYEKDINNNEDFAIEFYDYFNPSKKVVEYAYVAVIGGADSDAISTSVYSEFQNYFICERDISYPIIIDVQNNIELNRQTSVIPSLGNKYPFVVVNGASKYYSGTLSAVFIEMNNCQFDYENINSYRNQIDEFLVNGRAKILKNMNGDIYMINIADNIQRSGESDLDITHNFKWIECGDPNSVGDLYDNGFINTDIDREYGKQV